MVSSFACPDRSRHRQRLVTIDQPFHAGAPDGLIATELCEANARQTFPRRGGTAEVPVSARTGRASAPVVVRPSTRKVRRVYFLMPVNPGIG